MATVEFVLDNNLSHKVAAALAALDLPFHHSTDILPANTDDEDLIPEVAARGWILVTQDKKIRKRKHERAAMIQSGIGAFIYMGQADKSLEEMMRMLLRDLPEMRKLVSKRRPPFVFGISDRGKFEELR